MEARETRLRPDDWPGAIADTDGPQIVVAGPGTGKTEFLVQRVINLVESGKARRGEIVVLCFSRRAAADLRRRIEDGVGATGAPIDVTTFHGLALRLIEAVSGGDRLTPLTTLEQVSVVSSLLGDEDPEAWPLTYRGILTTPAFAAEVADFLLRCSERLLTPADLRAKSAERADWRGLPGLFDRYLARLGETGRTDYGSLLVSAVEVLRTRPGEELASNYRYVLVDEYQDTSPVQAEMARRVAAQHNNLTVAGDPYQSIYSFRGAELRNVADFAIEYPQCQRWVLAQSFRVPESILTAALRVVSSGDLPGAAGHVDPAPHPGRSEAYVFDQETGEAEWIAREVEHAIRVEGIASSAIAVLVRSKKELLNELSRALGRRNIPHDPPESRLVDHPAVRLIQDLTNLARNTQAATGVHSADADRAARRVLLGPLVGLELGAERALLRERKRTGASWSRLIATALPDREGLAALIDSPQWASQSTAVDGFWHLWTTLEGIESIVEDPNRIDWRRAWTSFAQVLARQAERDRGVSLGRYFDLTEEEDFEPTPLITFRSEEPRVTLTTLHQAKGLEFDVVFIANAVEGVFPDLRRSRRMLRPELLSPDRTTDAQAQHLFQVQEEMRLAYTAMTRARLRVAWTATQAGVDQGERRPSRFLVAASGSTSLADVGPPPPRVSDPVTLAEAEIELRRLLTDPGADDVDRLVAVAALADGPPSGWDPAVFPGVVVPGPDSPVLGESIHLSPSQADSYDRCPRRYVLERRLRLGDAASPYAHFGTLVHEALEIAEREVVGSGELHATLDKAIEAVEQVWESADFGSVALNRAWFGKAVETVSHLYEHWPNPNGRPTALETPVEKTIAGVDWMGKVDRVEDTGEGLRVVDYKTSTQAMQIADAATSVQLGFYASAIADKIGPVTEAQFWYPRAKTKSVTTRALDLENLHAVEEKMVQVTESIRAEVWAPRSGDHCKKCPFRHSCPAWPEGKGAFLP